MRSSKPSLPGGPQGGLCTTMPPAPLHQKQRPRGRVAASVKKITAGASCLTRAKPASFVGPQQQVPPAVSLLLDRRHSRGWIAQVFGDRVTQLREPAQE